MPNINGKHVPNTYYMPGTTKTHVHGVDLFLKPPEEVGASIILKRKETASQRD